MDNELFTKIIEDQIQELKDTLFRKGLEYATDDRLHNFRTAAKLEHGTMTKALGGFMAKHTVSIYDMINSGAQYSMDQWNEKIGDHIAYLFLLKAIRVEENDDMGCVPTPISFEDHARAHEKLWRR